MHFKSPTFQCLLIFEKRLKTASEKCKNIIFYFEEISTCNTYIMTRQHLHLLMTKIFFIFHYKTLTRFLSVGTEKVYFFSVSLFSIMSYGKSEESKKRF